MEETLNQAIINTQQNCIRLNEEIKKSQKILIEKAFKHW